MSQEQEKNDLHNVDELKNKIFSNSYDTKINPRHQFLANFKNSNIKDSLDANNTFKKNEGFKYNSFFKNFFIFSIVVFFGAVSFLLFNIFFAKNDISNENIEIAVIGNTFVNGGEKLPLIIEITNNNKVNLEFADLVVTFPQGSSFNETGNSLPKLRQSIGVIDAKSVKNEKTEIVIYGKQGSIHEILISLEYRIPDSNSIFVKDKLYKVTVNSTPVNLVIDGPLELTPNQEFTFKVKPTLKNTEQEDVSDTLLKIDYPFGFNFIKAEPAPNLGNNIWDLSKLNTKDDFEIKITGNMNEVFDGDVKFFNIFVGLASKKDKSEIESLFDSLSYSPQIIKPFIETKLLVNQEYKKEYAVSLNDPFFANVNWVSNMDTYIDDLVIKAKFSGNAFDDKKINFEDENNFYDSLNKTIVWDKFSREDFEKIRPFAKGSVFFNLKPPSLFNSNGSILIDPTINIEISTSGKESLAGNVLNKLESIEKKTIKFYSDISLLNKVDNSNKVFQNIGPFPPKVEKETTYTVTLSLVGALNNASQVKVVSVLGPRVNYKDLFLPKNENVIFDPNKREIIWTVGNLKRNEGNNTPSKEVSFQVSYTPSISEEGKNILILSKTTLTGYDDFANVELRTIKGGLSLNSKIGK